MTDISNAEQFFNFVSRYLQQSGAYTLEGGYLYKIIDGGADVFFELKEDGILAIGCKGPPENSDVFVKILNRPHFNTFFSAVITGGEHGRVYKQYFLKHDSTDEMKNIIEAVFISNSLSEMIYTYREQGRGTMGSSLRVLQIELTSRCNERCVHCYIPHGEKTRGMNSALLFRIIEQCADMGVQKIIFSGGEPMLHPDFIAALEAAAGRNLKIEVFSNLTLLNASIAGRLKAAAASVQASLYSMDNAIHDSVTQMPGSCEKTKQGIQTLIDQGTAVFISCPIMVSNKDSYPGVLDFARVHGANAAPNTFITAQSGGGRENLARRLSVDQALEVIRSILKNDSAYDAERFLPDYAGGGALPCVQEICAAALCVNAQGEALPVPEWHYVLGDLNTQTLRDIWEHSPELPKVRAAGDLRNFPRCASCPDIQFCGMSLAGNANETGDPLAVPPEICSLARKTRELVHAHHRQSAKETKESVHE